MNAILSGSAGVAILIDGGSLFSIDIDRLDEVVPRRPREVPYLLGDSEDQQVVEDVDAETVKQLLDEAWRGAEALQLALILMDADLSDETRALAATELEEALGTESTREQVEAVLWSRPLPAEASIEGAIAFCESTGATNARMMFEQIRARQVQIRDVWTTFEELPEPLFGDNAGDRARARVGLVREGAFREFVAAREESKSVAAVAAAVLLKPGVKALQNCQAIVAAWIKPLSEVRGERRDDITGVGEPLPIPFGSDLEQQIRNLLGRNPNAAAMLLRQTFADDLSTFLASKLPVSACEDVAAQVWLAVAEGIGSFQAVDREGRPIKFRTWLFAIGQQKAADFLRLRLRERALAKPNDEGARPAEHEALRAAIEKLDPAERTLLEWRYVDNCMPDAWLERIEREGSAAELGIEQEMAHFLAAEGKERNKKGRGLEQRLKQRLSRVMMRLPSAWGDPRISSSSATAGPPPTGTTATPHPASEPTPEVDSIVEALVHLHTESRRFDEGRARQSGLTGRQLRVIELLESSDSLSLSSLSEALRVQNRTVVGIIDRMERDGLVRRERSITDRRIVHIRLSDKALRLARRIRAEPTEMSVPTTHERARRYFRRVSR